MKKELSLYMGRYLAQKAQEFYKKPKYKELDISQHIEELNTSEDFENARVKCKELIKIGLESLTAPLASMTKFYTYVIDNAKEFSDINDLFMKDFYEKLSLAPSTKWLYIEHIVDFLATIENSTPQIKFNINYVNLRLKKPNTKEHDVLTYEEMIHFSNALETIKFKNEFEKCRAILICRIMLYAGITPKELAGLKLGKNFIITDNEAYLNLENREVKIFLPRDRIIEHMNNYCMLKENNTSGLLFYPINDANKSLSNPQVNDLIKSMLVKAKIKKTILNSTLLRVSFAVFLYNYRVDNMQYHISAIQKILGQSRREHTEKMIGFFSKNYTNTEHLFPSIEREN